MNRAGDEFAAHHCHRDTGLDETGVSQGVIEPILKYRPPFLMRVKPHVPADS